MILWISVNCCLSLFHVEGLMIRGGTVVSCISLFHIEGFMIL